MRNGESEKVKQSGSIRSSALNEIERAENANFLIGTEKILQSHEELMMEACVFDADKYLVGLENCQCLDLRTSIIRKIKDTDYITKRINTPFLEDANCDLWEKSVLEWCRGDEELARFLQIWSGYCLSGLTDFQGFLFLYGSGRNGKSVFLNIMAKLLGPYAIAIKSDTLMQKSPISGASGDIARLNGARFVTCNELPEGKHFDEELLKSITGQDTITARFLYGNDFNFKPTLKLMISGNHTPVIKGTDEGIWRRVNVVPFLAKIEKIDPNLTDKLESELPGILNWCIEGWKLYQLKGIVIPRAVTNETSKYRSDMDVIGQWIDDCLDDAFGMRLHLKDMYSSYQHWCKENGFRIITSKAFNRKLKEGRFGEPSRSSEGYCYSGFKLKSLRFSDCGRDDDVVEYDPDCNFFK
jgi:putative DNA primase/helicase